MFKRALIILGSLFVMGQAHAGPPIYGPNIRSQTTLQTGTTFYTSSGTTGQLSVTSVKFPDGSLQTTAGSAGAGYIQVNDEGSTLVKRSTINFIGTSITCVDNAGNLTTDCTISPAGTGDALIAGTQTWSGVNTYQNATTSPAIKITQTGNVGTGDGTGGAFVIDTTSNTGYGMQIYTNRANGTQLTGLLNLRSGSTSYDEPMLYIHSDSTGSVGGNADIRIDANNPDIELVETDQTAPAGKFEIAVQSNVLQFNARNAANTSFQNYLSMNSSGTWRFKELDNGGDFVGFRATQTLSGSTTWTLPAGDGTSGQAIVTNGSGVLSFATTAGSGDAVLKATQTWSGANTYASKLAPGAIKVNQTATTTDDPQTAAIAVNNTGNNNIGLAVYTNQGASQNDPLVLMQNDNTAFNAYFLELKNAAVGYPSTTIEMQAPIPSVEFRGTLTSPPTNEFQISEKSDQLRLEGRLADNSGFDSVMTLNRPTFGTDSAGLVYIGNNYGFPLNSLDVGGDTSASSSPGSAKGNVVIGRDYAQLFTAPDDGLLVEGSVGIGTTTPVTKLSIVGGATFTSSITMNGSLNISDQSNGSMVYNPSTGSDGLVFDQQNIVNTDWFISKKYVGNEVFRMDYFPASFPQKYFAISISSFGTLATTPRYKIDANDGKHIFSDMAGSTIAEFDPVNSSSFTIPIFASKGVLASSGTFTTSLAPPSKTLAQLQSLAPTQAGLMYYCSNCTVDGVVVSTGTGTGAFGRISARTTIPQ